MNKYTREKIDYEYRGMGKQWGEEPLIVPLPLKLNDFTLKSMREEVRNESAKACARAIEHEKYIDMLKITFYLACEKYTNGLETAEGVRYMYGHILEQLREIRSI